MPTKVTTPDRPHIDAAVLAGWGEIPTTILSDVTRGRLLVDAGLRPLSALEIGSRLVGRAVTVWCERADIGGTIHGIDAAGPGDVLVVDAGGCGMTAYVGDVLCGHARGKGIAGLIIDGAVRDIDVLASWADFPVFSRGSTARGPLSTAGGSVNEPIVLGGVPATPGDVVLADNDGICIVPAADAADLLARARRQLAAEAGWLADLAAGKTLAEALAAPDAG